MPELVYPYNLLYKVYDMSKLSDYENKVIILRYKQEIKSHREIEAINELKEIKVNENMIAKLIKMCQYKIVKYIFNEQLSEG